MDCSFLETLKTWHNHQFAMLQLTYKSEPSYKCVKMFVIVDPRNRYHVVLKISRLCLRKGYLCSFVKMKLFLPMCWKFQNKIRFPKWEWFEVLFVVHTYSAFRTYKIQFSKWKGSVCYPKFLSPLWFVGFNLQKKEVLLT